MRCTNGSSLYADYVPNEDADVSAELERQLRKRGIRVLTGTRVDGVEEP